MSTVEELTEKYSDLLQDTQGRTRGTFLNVPEETLAVLRDCWNLKQDQPSVDRVARRLVPVQSYSPNILNHLIKSPGFPTEAGSDGSEFFKPLNRIDVMIAEKMLQAHLEEALKDINYCANEQRVTFYFSFLKTGALERATKQEPHIDFKWNVVEPSKADSPSTKRSRKKRYGYEMRVPFIAFFPLIKEGMQVEVWKARQNHASSGDPGVLVDIPFGKMMLVRGDTVHAGGFKSSASGNPRGHLYVYRSGGEQHNLDTSNTYTIQTIHGMKELKAFYKHYDEEDPVAEKEEEVIRGESTRNGNEVVEDTQRDCVFAGQIEESSLADDERACLVTTDGYRYGRVVPDNDNRANHLSAESIACKDDMQKFVIEVVPLERKRQA